MASSPRAARASRVATPSRREGAHARARPPEGRREVAGEVVARGGGAQSGGGEVASLSQ